MDRHGTFRKSAKGWIVFAIKRAPAFGVLAAMFASATWIYARQGPPQQAGKPEKLAQAEETKKPEPLQPSEIVSDNLDRVSATAEQILQIVDRDPGMMVEVKKLLAEDAGENGQLLEEADLSDAAISELLRQDLHSRVIATRLLQRYGYLLPKLNPDSDLAAEHNLQMRTRAQELEHASEYQSAIPTTQTVISVGPPSPAERVATQARPARVPLADTDGGLSTVSQELPPALPEARLNLVKASSRELAPVAPPERIVPAAPAETALTAADVPLSLTPRPARARAASLEESEPVHMDRRPNPYADVPSLYDLYVQAKATSPSPPLFFCSRLLCFFSSCS